jgi:hypothetical protein
MNALASALYVGKVVHQRVTPKRHRLAYNVFAMCLDVDEIDEVDRRLRLFSRNRFNWAGFHDLDHGTGDGRPVGEHVRGVLAEGGLDRYGAHIEIVCYPRILGYVFNPLSVYFCRDDGRALGAIVYEVNNTFGERKSYVIPVGEGEAHLVRQSCAKEMYVSPFTRAEGRYTFQIRPPRADRDDLLIGIQLHDADGAVLNARFSGVRRPLSAATLGRALAAHPLMTLKVIGGIYVEAARLWAKGVPIVPRHVSPRFSVTVVGVEPATRLAPEPHA